MTVIIGGSRLVGRVSQSVVVVRRSTCEPGGGGDETTRVSFYLKEG